MKRLRAKSSGPVMPGGKGEAGTSQALRLSASRKNCLGVRKENQIRTRIRRFFVST